MPTDTFIFREKKINIDFKNTFQLDYKSVVFENVRFAADIMYGSSKIISTRILFPYLILDTRSNDFFIVDMNINLIYSNIANFPDIIDSSSPCYSQKVIQYAKEIQMLKSKIKYDTCVIVDNQFKSQNHNWSIKNPILISNDPLTKTTLEYLHL